MDTTQIPAHGSAEYEQALEQIAQTSLDRQELYEKSDITCYNIYIPAWTNTVIRLKALMYGEDPTVDSEDTLYADKSFCRDLYDKEREKGVNVIWEPQGASPSALDQILGPLVANSQKNSADVLESTGRVLESHYQVDRAAGTATLRYLVPKRDEEMTDEERAQLAEGNVTFDTLREIPNVQLFRAWLAHRADTLANMGSYWDEGK